MKAQVKVLSYTLIIVLKSSRYHAKTRRSYFSALLNFSSSNLSSTRSGE